MDDSEIQLYLSYQIQILARDSPDLLSFTLHTKIYVLNQIYLRINNHMKRPLLKDNSRNSSSYNEYKGETIDQKYGEGPEQSRSCTDIFCCLLFIVFIAALGYVASIAFSTGNPEYLVYPFDKMGYQCGYTPGYQSYPYIFIGEYIDLGIPEPYYVCVSNCPSTADPAINCKISPGMKPSFCTDLQPSYDTRPLVTYCFPQDTTIKVANELVEGILSIGVLQKYFSDLSVAWKLILAMVGVSLVISIFYSVLIRYFAGCMVWTMILLLLTLLLAVGLATVMIANDVQAVKDLINYDSLPEPFKDTVYQKAVGGLCLSLFIIGFLIVCCMKRQIKISIGVIKAAADFVRSCCSAFFIPFYISIMQLIFIVFWVAVILYLFSSNTGKIESFAGTPFGMVVWNESNQKLIIFYLFGLLWVINFFAGLGAFWVSSTAAIWYFESGNPTSPVTRSFCRSFYHLGSIAFGSLLIAIVMFIRIVLEYITNQMKQKMMGMAQGRAVSCMMKCANCIMACFQRLIRFITENAYIMIAITGKNFCASASESFYLMLRSAAQFFISHGTTKLFVNVGTALIVTMCTVIGYFFITNISPFKDQIQSPVFLTIIFAIVSLPVSWAFMEFFEKGANTILMCYCVELDLSKKKTKCPTALKNFLEDYADSSQSQI